MILLTGANGFIGSQLSKHIKGVRRVVRESLGAEIDHVRVENIDSSTDWSTALQGITTVVHLAAIAHKQNVEHDRIHEINVNATINLARQAAITNVKRFIFLSTIRVNGDKTTGGDRFSSASPSNPTSVYAQTKYKAEELLLEICEANGMELVIIRPPLVYGPNAKGSISLLLKLINTLPILPFASLNNKRSFISVYNLVDFILCIIAKKDDVRGVYLVAEVPPISTKTFVLRSAEMLNRKVYLFPFPVFLLRFLLSLIGKKSLAAQLFDDLVVNSDDLKNRLNWEQKYSTQESIDMIKQES